MTLTSVRRVSCGAVLAVGLLAGCSGHSAPAPASAPQQPDLSSLLGGLLGGGSGGGAPDLSKLIGGALGGSLGGASGGGAGPGAGLGNAFSNALTGGETEPTAPPAAAPPSEQKPIGSEASAYAFQSKYNDQVSADIVALDASKSDAMSTADCNCRGITDGFVQVMKSQHWHVKDAGHGTNVKHTSTRMSDGWRFDSWDNIDAQPVYDQNDKVVVTSQAQQNVHTYVIVTWVGGDWKTSHVGEYKQ